MAFVMVEMKATGDGDGDGDGGSRYAEDGSPFEG